MNPEIPQAPQLIAQPVEHKTDGKFIVTLLFLLFMYPVGIITMWLWMKDWPKWLKVVITLPFALALLMIVWVIIISSTNLGQGGV